MATFFQRTLLTHNSLRSIIHGYDQAVSELAAGCSLGLPSRTADECIISGTSYSLSLVNASGSSFDVPLMLGSSHASHAVADPEEPGGCFISKGTKYVFYLQEKTNVHEFITAYKYPSGAKKCDREPSCTVNNYITANYTSNHLKKLFKVTTYFTENDLIFSFSKSSIKVKQSTEESSDDEVEGPQVPVSFSAVYASFYEISAPLDFVLSELLTDISLFVSTAEEFSYVSEVFRSILRPPTTEEKITNLQRNLEEMCGLYSLAGVGELEAKHFKRLHLVNLAYLHVKRAGNPELITDLKSFANKVVSSAASNVLKYIKDKMLKSTMNVRNTDKSNFFRLTANTGMEAAKFKIRDESTLMLKETDALHIVPSGAGRLGEEMRQIMPSYLGFICPLSTPENAKVGLIKSPTALTWISADRTCALLSEIWHELGPTSAPRFDQNLVPLFIDGTFFGFSTREAFAQLKQRLNRSSKYFDVCLFATAEALKIHLAGGLLCKPLFTPEAREFLRSSAFNPSESLEQLLALGYVQYVSTKELAESPSISQVFMEPRDFLASTDQKSYSEVDPAALFSSVVCALPSIRNIHSPRATYGAKQEAQALNAYKVGALHHYGIRKTLLSAAKPLASSADAFYFDSRSLSGVNMVVALMAMPDNPEDSSIMSASAARQIMPYVKHAIVHYKPSQKMIDSSLDNQLVDLVIGRLKVGSGTVRREDRFRMAKFQYRHIDDNGIARVGSMIQLGDVLVCAYTVNGDEYEEHSLVAGINDCGKIVDIHVKGQLCDGVVSVKITAEHKYNRGNSSGSGISIDFVMESTRHFQTGDKLALRYSQKSTVSKIVPDSQMPLVISGPNAGMRPNLIISPAILPSRMTPGLGIEGYLAKEVLQRTKNTFGGETFVDLSCSAVDVDGLYGRHLPIDTKDLGALELEECLLPNGTTALVYIVPLRVIVLPHNTTDKIQTIGEGKQRSALTHQPAKGRRKGGGTRFGDADASNIIANGGVDYVHNHTTKDSDATEVVVCKSCGKISGHPNEPPCSVAGHEHKLAVIPYSLMAVTHMMRAAGKDILLKVEDSA